MINAASHLNKPKLDWKKITQEKFDGSQDKFRKTVSDQFREERLNYSKEDGIEKFVLKKEIAERRIKKAIGNRETETLPRKSLNLKSKRKVLEEDEAKNIHTENSLHETLTLGNLYAQHIVSPTASRIPATTKEFFFLFYLIKKI